MSVGTAPDQGGTVSVGTAPGQGGTVSVGVAPAPRVPAGPVAGAGRLHGQPHLGRAGGIALLLGMILSVACFQSVPFPFLASLLTSSSTKN